MTGLGMGNMKAGVAALSLAFVWLKKNADRWPGKISYTAVADETVFGPDGAGWLLQRRPDLRGDAVICGEGPGGMDLAIAEKGLLWIELTATAPSGQGMVAKSSGSAISRLARAITEIDAWNDVLAEPPEELMLVKAHAGEHGLRLSVNSGTISGGQFVSQVASQAKAEVDFRIPPGMSTSEIEERLENVCEQIDGLSFRRIKGWEPNWTVAQEQIAQSVSTAAKHVMGRTCNPVVRLPASDASRWRALGTPAVCFGPQPLLASGVDDFAIAEDIVDCAKIYALAALQYLTDKN
jgi:succinyl-diaminopimelate desuccinylase